MKLAQAIFANIDGQDVSRCLVVASVSIVQQGGLVMSMKTSYNEEVVGVVKSMRRS